MRRSTRIAVLCLAVMAGAVAVAPAGAQDAASEALDPSTPSTSVPVRADGYRVRGVGRTPSLEGKLLDADTTASPRAAAPSPACPAICTLQTFPTMQDPDGASPGDPTGAAGDTHVVAAVNVSVAVYDRNGVEEVPPTLLGDTVPTPLGFYFDPKVIYDQYADTYVLTFLGVDDDTKASEIYVVSIPDATATNTATWCAREVDGDQPGGDGKQWADYPGLGYNQDAVFIATNQFNFGPGGNGSQVISFDKAGLYHCGDPLTYTAFTTDDTRLSDGKKIWGIRPAETVGAVPGPEYGLATLYNCPGGTCPGDGLVITRFNGTNFKATRMAIDPVKMPLYFATQKGTPLSQWEAYWDPGDLRLTNAFYDSDTNMLYGAHAIRKNVKKKDGWVEVVNRWYEVAPGSPLKSTTIERVGTLGTSKKDAGWPVIATDASGNVWLNYSRASGAKGAKEYLSAFAAVIYPGETKPEEIIEFASGSSLYAPFPGPERWGDYNAINRDPLDPEQMWMVNQRAATVNKFQQYVAQMDDV